MDIIIIITIIISFVIVKANYKDNAVTC